MVVRDPGTSARLGYDPDIAMLMTNIHLPIALAKVIDFGYGGSTRVLKRSKLKEDVSSIDHKFISSMISTGIAHDIDGDGPKILGFSPTALRDAW